MQETIIIVCIMDCPMITVHAGKCYKDIIDSGAAISLLRYSTYKNIEDSFKTPIQPTTAKLKTADGSPMMALGMMDLHLRIVEFKFTHNFIIYDRLLDTEIIFNIDIQKKFSLSYAWGKEKNCYIQRDGKSNLHVKLCKKATIHTVKSSLKIPLQQNGIVPIKITGALRNIWLASSQMKIQQMVKIPTSISLMAFTRSKEKQLSTSWFQIIPISTSPLTKENT